MRPLSPASPRRVAAGRFGAELRKAMIARNVGAKRLSAAIETGTSAVAVWLKGDNLPRTDTAQRLAEALNWPKLLVIAREGRRGYCERCGQEFVNEGGAPKRFCSGECLAVAEALRVPPAGRALADAIRAELEHGVPRRKPLAAALDQYVRSDSKRIARVERSERRLSVVQVAVAGYCGACEPSGVCRAPECELRPVSPLPLALRPDKTGDTIKPAEGSWGPTHGAAQLARIREANAERWSRPGERERQRERSLAMHATRTPEEAAAVVAKSKAAYPAERRSATSRRVHAARRTA
jgi:ribosomal protein S18 acetylase RimI-like enzyme